MKKNRLNNILESILFVSGEGVSKEDLLDKLEVLEEELDTAILELGDKYSKESGIHIITYRNKVQLSSNSDYSDEVANVLNPIRERKLSRAMLEAIAIVAYKQPVTRLDIENIRGVNSDYAIQNLLKHKMVEVVGRKDAIGKPMLFGTTEDFLKRFEISNIDELPDYDELLESIAVINGDNKEALFNNFEVKEDEEFEEAEEEFTLPENEEIPEFLQDEEGLEKFDDSESETLARLNSLNEAVGS